MQRKNANQTTAIELFDYFAINAGFLKDAAIEEQHSKSFFNYTILIVFLVLLLLQYYILI